MNYGIENRQIEEMICNNNFAYIMNDDAGFSGIEYKVIQNQNEGCFVKLAKNKYNGRVQLIYLCSEYKSLEIIKNSLDINGLMAIVYNLLKNIQEVMENGFLSCKNINISTERIYVEPHTNKVHLVYLPAAIHFYDSDSAFESELRKTIAKLIGNTGMANGHKLQKFMADLSNEMVTFEMLLKEAQYFTGNLSGSSKGNNKEINIYNMPERTEYRAKAPGEVAGTDVIMPMLLSRNTRTVYNFNITKNIFVIGKKSGVVDGVIADINISRMHCKIEKYEKGFRLVDLGSTNGTFLNGKRLAANIPQPLKNGDQIRLANLDFVFEIK